MLHVELAYIDSRLGQRSQGHPRNLVHPLGCGDCANVRYYMDAKEEV